MNKPKHIKLGPKVWLGGSKTNTIPRNGPCVPTIPKVGPRENQDQMPSTNMGHMTQTNPKMAQRDRPTSSKPTPLSFAGEQTLPPFQRLDNPSPSPTSTLCSCHIGLSTLPLFTLEKLLSSPPKPNL